MKVLAIDVGTGTQDILLYQAGQPIENAPKLVMPSPTVTVAAAIRRATARRAPVLFHGPMMGGGPCHWAASDHLSAGLPFFATPGAAQTFDDDLAAVAAQGVTLVSADEAAALPDTAVRVRSGDLDYDLILDTLHRFGVEGEPDAVAVAVFDHGNAPPGYSDRVFRFEYLRDHVHRTADLLALVHQDGAVPARFTRFQAVADTLQQRRPLFVMDTAAAAIVGALEDGLVAAERQAVLANVGNFHCLAFHLLDGAVIGLFEHHTGELTREELERYLRQLADGSIRNDEVYADKGHGAIVFQAPPTPARFLSVTGPRRGLLAGSALQPYLAVPHGDMMLAGCFGLVRAAAPHLGLDWPALG